MIVRGPHPETGWVVLSNKVVRDSRLSLRAVGLLAHLLSHEPGWAVNSVALAKYWKCGRDQIRTAIQELINHGYAVRTKMQNEAGHWSTETIIFDCPQTLGENSESYPLPTPEKPDVGGLGAKRTNIQKKNYVGLIANETLISNTQLCSSCAGFGNTVTHDDTGRPHINRCEHCQGAGVR